MQRIKPDLQAETYRAEWIFAKENRTTLTSLVEAAAEQGREDIIEKLFTQAEAVGFDTHVISTSAMDYAVRGGHLSLVIKLHARHPDNLDIEADDGCNLFHEAAARDYLLLLKWMHEQGFDVHQKNKSGHDAMYYAVAVGGSLATVQFLHSLGFDIHQMVNITKPYSKDNCTMMHLAMLNKNHGEEIAKWLYAQGVSVLKETRQGDRPSKLVWIAGSAACRNWIETIEKINLLYDYMHADKLHKIDFALDDVFANDLLLAVNGEHPFVNEDKLQEMIGKLVRNNYGSYTKYCLEFAKLFFHYYRVTDAIEQDKPAKRNLLKIAVVLSFVAGDQGIYSMDCIYGIRCLTGQQGFWLRHAAEVSRQECEQWYIDFARNNTTQLFHCMNELLNDYKSFMDEELTITDVHPFMGIMNHLYKIQSVNHGGFFAKQLVAERESKRRVLGRSLE